MKSYLVTLIGASVLATSFVVIRQNSHAQNTGSQPANNAGGMMGNSSGAKNTNEWYSVFVTNMPAGYRDWKLVTVAHEEGSLTDIRAVLGNDIAIKAYREGTLPFPEGAIIARIAWTYEESEENNKSFVPFLKGGVQHSFVAGSPTNGVQFMVKDSKKYASTGGWGYAHFNDGKPAETAFMQSCYPCHAAIKSRDFVFARYSK